MQGGRAVKTAQTALDAQVLARYETLTEAEIKTLVVDDKWFGTIRNAVDKRVQRLIRQLAARVESLEERYARSLPELEHRVENLARRVGGHFARMGASP